MLAALTSDTHYGYSKKTHEIHEKFWQQLASEKLDVLFHAGDIGSYAQDQVQRSLYQMRKYLPNIPILVSEGNHDLWDTTLKMLRSNPDDLDRDDYRASRRYKKRYPQLRLNHQLWYKETGIVHLDGGHYDLTPEIVVVGFDGWYHVTDPRERSTKDDIAICEMIESAPAMIYLREKAYKDLEKVLNHPTDGKTVIGMTHMPPGRPDDDDGLDTSFWDGYLRDRVIDLARSSHLNGFFDWGRDLETQAQDVIDAYLGIEGSKVQEVKRFLDSKTKEELGEVLNSNRAEWNANPKYLDFLTEKCDYLLYGHSHSKCDRVYNGCRVLNCGSDYDKPKHTLFEI